MIGHGRKAIDLDILSKQISDSALASYYIDGLSVIPEVISSPLRRDEHPSFWAYSPDGIKVRWYDYGTGESGGMWDFIMKKYNISFEDALYKADREMLHSNPNHISVGTYTGKNVRMRSERSDYQIRTQMREWEPRDFEYWNSYGVPTNWLLHADIYPVSYIFVISESGFTRTIKADPYAYTFIERKDGICTEKVYQPFNTEGFKWRSGHDKSVWDLWTKLPETGEQLIITSSRKDALCIWAQVGIPAVSLQGEGYGAKAQVMEELKTRFRNVYVLFDNDQNKEKNYGRLDGEKLCAQYNLKQLEIPEEYKCKDPSDLFHFYGKETVQKVFSIMLNQIQTI